MHTRLRFAATFLTFFLIVSTNRAFGQFNGLVKHLPNGPNMLVLFNVKSLHDSALGQKEKWAERQEEMFNSGLIMVPPHATLFAAAAEFDIERMRSLWKVDVAELDYEPNIPKVAARFGGHVDRIEDQEAAVLPSDTYVLKFGPRMAGMMTPANRQKVGAWVRDVYSSSTRQPLSPYLLESHRYADELGTPVIMAMDLTNVFSPAYIRSRLETIESLKGQQVDLDKLSEALASIQGVMVGLTVSEQVVGAIKVDFAMDVSMTKEFAKPLLLEILAQRGAMINEFQEWTAKVSGNQILLQGYLYESGRRRLFSVLDAPPALHYAQEKTSLDPEQTQEKEVALASKQYFTTIESLLKDLRGDRQSSKSVTTGQVGMWYEKYARKINHMPVLNVDRDLVEFGTYVANQLRQAESAMKGVGARQAVRMTQQENVGVYNYSYGGGGGYNRWGGGYAGGYRYRADPRASLRLAGQQDAKIRTQERVRGYGQANVIGQSLEAELAQVRIEMTNKYQIEF